MLAHSCRLLQHSPPTRNETLTEKMCFHSLVEDNNRDSHHTHIRITTPGAVVEANTNRRFQTRVKVRRSHWLLPSLYCCETRGQGEREIKRGRKCCNSWHQVLLLPSPSSLNPMFSFGTVTPTMTEPIPHQLTHTRTQTYASTHSRQAKPEQWGQSSSLMSCDSD